MRIFFLVLLSSVDPLALTNSMELTPLVTNMVGENNKKTGIWPCMRTGKFGFLRFPPAAGHFLVSPMFNPVEVIPEIMEFLV